MAVTAANLTASYSNTDATSYATASVAPGSNRLLLLAVESNTGDSSTPAAPTVTGNGLTWVQVASIAYDTGGTRRGRLTLFRAMGASPSSGAITIDFGAATQTVCVWSLDEFAGVDTGGTNGSAAVVQSNTASSAGTSSLSVTLASFADATNNAAYGAFSKQDNPSSFTAEGGYTTLSDTASTTPKSRLGVEWKVGEDTTVTATAGSTNQGGCVAVEIAMAAAAAALPKGGLALLGVGA